MTIPVQGMLVTVKTSSFRGAGTDEYVYVGLVGRGGGSEFPLDVQGFDDLEEGTRVKYWFGDVWEGHLLSGAKRPFEAQTWNDPAWRHIDLDKIDYVYLRKQSTKPRTEDDAWRMDEVEVRIYGPRPRRRVFRKTGDIWLGNEYGQIVYLHESG